MQLVGRRLAALDAAIFGRTTVVGARAVIMNRQWNARSLIREPVHDAHSALTSISFLPFAALIHSVASLSTTSGLRMSFLNCSCCSSSSALSVGPGYLSFDVSAACIAH